MLSHLSPKERLAYAALAIVFLAVAGYVGGRSYRPSEPIVIQELKSKAPLAMQDSTVIIHVTGCVAKPGVYKLPPGSRVNDAILAAGGLGPKADPDQLDLAARLIDGTQVFVPVKGTNPAAVNSAYDGKASSQLYLATQQAGGAATSKGGGAKHPTGPVSLSTATADQLQSIPGIGPSTADRILDYRKTHGSFKSVNELTGIGAGIGPKKLEKIRKWLLP